jgi:hypothetical protein
MDGDQFMIPVIPDGVDLFPDPTYPKLIQRTLAAGGDGTIPTSDPDTWDSARIFETLAQHKERSAVTVTDINMPDSLKQGTKVFCLWKVQSYMKVDAQLMLLNLASSNVWMTVNAKQVGTAANTTYSFRDRTTGLSYYAKEYTFLAAFYVPSQPGIQQIYFRSRDSEKSGSQWMAENLSADADPLGRQVEYNGMYGRFIERSINP